MSGAVTQSEFAAALGVHKSHVTRLKQAGRLVLDESGRVLVEESRARIAETAEPSRDDVAARYAAARGRRAGGAADQAQPAAADPSAERVGGGYQTARAVKEKYLALAAKRDYEQSCGKLIEAEKVRAAIADAVTILRSRLEALPATAGPQVAAESDAARCVALLRDHVEQYLQDMSNHFSRLQNGVVRD